jgi:HlyD family secretion protein
LNEDQLKAAQENMANQLSPGEADVNQKKADYDLRAQQLEDLKVKAGMSGVLQLVPVERGSNVGANAQVARVADPKVLKAELRISETQTKDLKIGQYAEVDTRNGAPVKGHVARIDPAAQNGTVGVDITLEGALPPGARPDLSVDGTVEIGRLENINKVGRPAFGQENQPVQLFKCTNAGEAVRVTVKLGVSSVNEIEILEGLQPGDKVILSDMSQYDAFPRVRTSQCGPK